MEFQYDKFTEEWAKIYKPMLHAPGNERFFICDSYAFMTQFMEQMEPEHTPCVVIESQQEGSVRGNMDYPRYTWYFLVRSGETHDGFAAVRAKGEAKRHLFEFVNFMRCFIDPDREQQLQAIPLPEDSYLYQLREAIVGGSRCMQNIGIEEFVYESLNELYDTWYGCCFTLDDTQQMPLCYDRSLY